MQRWQNWLVITIAALGFFFLSILFTKIIMQYTIDMKYYEIDKMNATDWFQNRTDFGDIK